MSINYNKYYNSYVILCIVWESNPGRSLGRRTCYHYTNDAMYIQKVFEYKYTKKQKKI